MKLKTDEQLDAMRESGKMLATILQIMTKEACAGMTPKDLSRRASEELKKLGGTPSFLGFEGYPDVICISVNDQVQHAIPTAIPLADGDIVNFDFGVTYKGMVTDAGTTVCIGGNPNNDQKRLLEGTERALYAAIDKLKSGVKVGDISATIEAVLKKYRLGIVRELVGHGVGFELHEDPEIPNYGRAGTGPILHEGYTIAIEPITTLGKPDIYQEKDGWTLRTWDQSLSAQFEHTLLVTKNGCEILTHV